MKSGGVAISAGARRRSHSNRKINFWSKIAISLTEPRVVHGALEGLAELGWLRPEVVRVRDGGRPTVRFRINPRLLAGRHDRSRE
jgi:hypothetical protein